MSQHIFLVKHFFMKKKEFDKKSSFLVFEMKKKFESFAGVLFCYIPESYGLRQNQIVEGIEQIHDATSLLFLCAYFF